MNRIDIRTKMAELQREYSKLASDLKVFDEEEKAKVNIEQFKDYTLKVLVNKTQIDDEPTLYPVLDEDRKDATVWNTLVVTDNNKDGSSYILLKTADELARVQLLFKRLDAAIKMTNKGPEPEKYIKILLGE